MARMSSKNRREFDAAASATLRDIADGAETADAAEAGIALNTLTDAYWDNDEIPNGVIAIIVNVSAADYSDTDEVYDLYFEADTSSAFSSAVEVARLKSIKATGSYEVTVSSALIEKLEAGATHLRVRLDVTGTSPSITYGAYAVFLAP